MIISLPWPHKILWPNGRTLNRRYKAAETAKHKAWAFFAATKAKGALTLSDGRIPVQIVFYPKPRGPAPDRDNAISGTKAYLDGLAMALDVNDSRFDILTPIMMTSRESRVEIRIGE